MCTGTRLQVDHILVKPLCQEYIGLHRKVRARVALTTDSWTSPAVKSYVKVYLTISY